MLDEWTGSDLQLATEWARDQQGSGPRKQMIELLKTKASTASAVHGGVAAPITKPDGTVETRTLSQRFSDEEWDSILTFLETGKSKFGANERACCAG